MKNINPKEKKAKILLVGIYDKNTVSLASNILKSYVEQFDVANNFEIATKEFSIFDDTVESITKGIAEENPDIVGLSMFTWTSNQILEIIKHIDATIILGGPQVTGIEEELIRENSNIDIIITGEGEVTFKELLEYFCGENRIEEVKGVTTKTIKTDPREVIENLDSIPSAYERIFKEHPDISWISFETSRGCPMGCKYCSWSSTRRMRYYSLERVKKDLDIILSQNNINFIYLCDSNILVNKDRAKQILQHIIDSGSNKKISFEFNAEHLDDEIIDLLAQLPNNEFDFGIQSINKRALDEMGRRFNKDKFEENFGKMVDKFKESNIRVDLIYGLPGDDINGFKESLNYAISLDKVKRVITYPLTILPGSEFFRNMDKYGIKLRDKKSYIEKENFTFSEKDMELAKKYSFFTAVIYLNDRLKEYIKDFAEEKGKRYVDAISEFMESLQFDITGGVPYPDMIPSVKEGFEQRNMAFKNIIGKYDDIIDAFKVFSGHKYDSQLSDYKNYYSEHYYKLKSY